MVHTEQFRIQKRPGIELVKDSEWSQQIDTELAVVLDHGTNLRSSQQGLTEDAGIADASQSILAVLHRVISNPHHAI